MKKKLLVLIVLLMVLLGGDYMLRRTKQPPTAKGFANVEVEYLDNVISEESLKQLQICVDRIGDEVEKIRSIIKQKGE